MISAGVRPPQKTDLETNHLNLENQSLDNVTLVTIK